MDTGFFFRGLILGFVIAAPVGPVGILCVYRTLTKGKIHGLISGLGAATADAIYGAIAALGLTFISSFLNFSMILGLFDILLIFSGNVCTRFDVPFCFLNCESIINLRSVISILSKIEASFARCISLNPASLSAMSKL